jgi:mannose-6-phosphate isomerase-like protein (cupin superfamily)
VHSLDNPGRIPVVLIDVWTGGYLAEDDLVFAPALPT